MKKLPLIRLSPPLLTSEHIKEFVPCIRGHRERIFRVCTEIRDNKLICHNYGHGGAGWTFLFGCVQESIRQFEEFIQHNPLSAYSPVCIIGAGCYGLLTAISLKLKGYQVQIIAKEHESIASYKAAGFFFPRHRKCSTPEEISIFCERGMESYKTYLNIALGRHPFIKTGPTLMPAYYSPHIDPGFESYIQKGLVDEPEDVVIDFGTSKQYPVRKYTILYINPAAIMSELTRLVQELRISITRQEITSFDEIQTPAIFNCTGLGAKQLTHDPRMIPVQGHLITLKNQPNPQELQYMINVKISQSTPRGGLRDELIYFAPKDEGILGITFIRGQNNPLANSHEFDRLLERCKNFFGT